MEGDGGDQDRELTLGADGSAVTAVANAALAGESVEDRGAEDRDRGLGLATLVGEDHRNSQVEGDLAGDRVGERADVPQQPVPPAGLAAGEVGPGGRDNRQVDPPAIVVPDPAVDHVGADGEADSPERGGHDQGRSAGMKAEPLPEHQVALAVDVEIAVGCAEGEGVVEMPPVALDEARGDGHPPLPAALSQVGERGALRRLAEGTVVRAEAVAGVEQLRRARRSRHPASRAVRSSSSARCRLVGTSRMSQGIWIAAAWIFMRVHLRVPEDGEPRSPRGPGPRAR